MALIVSSSSNKLQLQNLAVNINDLCIQKSVKLNVKLVPRVQNQIADSLGKSFDFDDWKTTDAFPILVRYIGYLLS